MNQFALSQETKKNYITSTTILKAKKLPLVPAGAIAGAGDLGPATFYPLPPKLCSLSESNTTDIYFQAALTATDRTYDSSESSTEDFFLVEKKVRLSIKSSDRV